MTLLEQELGRCLEPDDVAKFLRCDVATVLHHWKELGGLRIGDSLLFLERRFANALLQRTEGQLDSSSGARRQKVQKSAPDKESGSPVGGSKKVGTVKSRKRKLSPDVHGILV
jgi:hypothetical protein